MLTDALEKLQNKFPANVVRNQKYNVVTFLPIVFYEQFKFFFNLYFLLVALSQFIPALKIGVLLLTVIWPSHLTLLSYRLHRHIYCPSCIRTSSHNG